MKKKILSFVLALTVSATAVLSGSIMAFADEEEQLFKVTINYSAGGKAGYNTIGDLENFNDINSKDFFELEMGSGTTIAAIPDEGNTVTEITVNDAPILSDSVMKKDNGTFVLDLQMVDFDFNINITFAKDTGANSIEATGDFKSPPSPQPGPQNSSNINITIPENGTIGYEVTFGEEQDEITENGVISVVASHGADVLLTFTPDKDCEFKEVIIDGVIYSVDEMGRFTETENGAYTYNLQNLQKPVFVEARFEKTGDDPISAGDVNADGAVDIVDVVAVRSHIVGNTTLGDETIGYGDVNNDKVLDITDVVKIRSIIVNA